MAETLLIVFIVFILLGMPISIALGVGALGAAILYPALNPIIIPTRDRWSLLQQCLRSIEERTNYTRYEVIILDNEQGLAVIGEPQLPPDPVEQPLAERVLEISDPERNGWLRKV